MLLLAAVIICASQFDEYYAGYFIKVPSEAKAMSKNNLIIVTCMITIYLASIFKLIATTPEF